MDDANVIGVEIGPDGANDHGNGVLNNSYHASNEINASILD